MWFLRNSWGPGWGEGGYMRINTAAFQWAMQPTTSSTPEPRGLTLPTTAPKKARFTKPYNTVAEGADAVTSGGHLRIKAGATAETVTITKAMTVHAYGGNVLIGQ